MADLINEIAVKLSEDNLAMYYKYRYTFDKEQQEEADQKIFFSQLWRYIKSHYAIGEKMTGGIEHYTKGMMKCKPHCHIHFISKVKADTIRKGIMRQFELIGRVQSCKAEVLVDESKFWRYPLKQQKGESAVEGRVTGFTEEDKILMRDLAYECWKQSAEVLVGKLEKKAERSSKERLFSYLDSLGFTELDTEKLICCQAYKYYVDHEDNFSWSTVDGYVHIYRLSKNFISYEEFYNMKH